MPFYLQKSNLFLSFFFLYILSSNFDEPINEKENDRQQVSIFHAVFEIEQSQI